MKIKIIILIISIIIQGSISAAASDAKITDTTSARSAKEALVLDPELLDSQTNQHSGDEDGFDSPDTPQQRTSVTTSVSDILVGLKVTDELELE